MAIYVMLQFENDAEAEEVVTDLIKTGLVTSPGKYPDSSMGMGEVKLRGVWKKPTQFCTCTRKKDSSWTRGTKYGWWVCTSCGKPSEEWSKGIMLYNPLGTNLLPRELIAEHLPQNPQGKPSVMEWSFLLPKEEVYSND